MVKTDQKYLLQYHENYLRRMMDKSIHVILSLSLKYMLIVAPLTENSLTGTAPNIYKHYPFLILTTYL